MKVIGINKESISNHHRVEMYCDISGTEEYTPFANLPFGPAPRAQARCLGPVPPGVTAFWASPRFGHPHSHIPSVLGIPGGGCPKR